MADEKYIFRQAKRIHDDCVSSQQNGTMPMDGEALVNSFNDLLERAQETFPDNGIIQSLEEIGHSGRMQQKAQNVQEVKSRTSKLADALDINLGDLKNDTIEDLRPIELNVSHDVDVDQQQEQSQQQQQYVDIEQILEDVDRATMPPESKEELKEIVEEFHDELENKTDESRLHQLLNRAEEYSVDVTAKLGILGLQYGITDLLK